MDTSKLFDWIKIPMIIFIGVLIYVFIFNNQVLKDKASLVVEETTTYTPKLKRERPDLYLKNIEKKAIDAVDRSEDQLFQLRTGHDLITTRFKSDVAQLEMINIKLERLKGHVQFLKDKISTNVDENKKLGLRTEMTSIESQIKLLLLDKVSLNKTINKYEKEIDQSFDRLDTAGKVNAKLRSFLKSVQGAINSAQIYNRELIGGINSSGYSEVQALMSEVKVISDFMEESSERILVDDLFVDDMQNLDSMFNDFMGVVGDSKEIEVTP